MSTINHFVEKLGQVVNPKAETVENGRHAPMNTTSHSNTAHVGVSHTHGVWAAGDLCMLVVVCLVCVRTVYSQLMKA